MESGSWKDMAEFQRFLDRRMAQYNRAPQVELGGVSPAQAQALLDDRWDGTGPLRIAEDLPSTAFDGVEALLMVNAQRLLRVVADEGPIRLTPAGNLPRAFVARMLDTLSWYPGFVTDLRDGSRVLNEEDVRPLHITRVVLELARLLRRAGRQVRTTAEGRTLSAPDRAGALAARLFRTYFKALDLRYLTQGIGGEEIQSLFPLILWRLAGLDVGWRTASELTDAVTTPEHRAAWDELLVPLWNFMQGRVLNPLCDFGLLETDLDGWSLESLRYRRTPLFSRFLSWEFR